MGTLDGKVALVTGASRGIGLHMTRTLLDDARYERVFATCRAPDTATALQALQQRTWLLHWSLFVYWNDSAKGGLEQLVDLFHSEKYKQAITTNAPHLLRYLTAAVLLCKRRVTKKAAAGSSAEAPAGTTSASYEPSP